MIDYLKFIEEGATIKQVMDGIERKIVVDALKKFPSVNQTSQFLGITRQGLMKKMVKHRLSNYKSSEPTVHGSTLRSASL